MTQGRRWLIIGLLVVGAVIAAGSPVLDVVLRQEGTETFEVDEAVTALDVETRNGPVTVTVGDEVTVVADLRWSLREPDPQVEVDGGVLRIRDGCPLGGWPFGSCQVGVAVTAPADLAAQLVTTNGAISFDGREGDVDARSTNGRVRGQDLAAVGVVARTTNGDIELGFTVVPDAVEATTVNGGIEMAVPEASYEVDADTTNGPVRVEVPTDPSSTHRIQARTVNGPVTITSP